MDETYRMLGREHEADLEREALKWRRAAEATGGGTPRPSQKVGLGKRLQRVVAWACAVVGREPRVEA